MPYRSPSLDKGHPEDAEPPQIIHADSARPARAPARDGQRRRDPRDPGHARESACHSSGLGGGGEGGVVAVVQHGVVALLKVEHLGREGRK